MAMTRKQRRITILAVCALVLAAAAGLVLTALEDTIVFFRTPSEVAEKNIAPGTRFRLGGLVDNGSIRRGEGRKVAFVVTDLKAKLKVSYDGILPDLFREGQGVVAEGVLGPNGVFIADTVLAKHDETYMPPEVAAALKKQGLWKDGRPGAPNVTHPTPAANPNKPTDNSTDKPRP